MRPSEAPRPSDVAAGAAMSRSGSAFRPMCSGTAIASRLGSAATVARGGPSRQVVISSTVETTIEIRPFHVHMPDEEIADLHRRIRGWVGSLRRSGRLRGARLRPVRPSQRRVGRGPAHHARKRIGPLGSAGLGVLAQRGERPFFSVRRQGRIPQFVQTHVRASLVNETFRSSSGSMRARLLSACVSPSGSQPPAGSLQNRTSTHRRTCVREPRSERGRSQPFPEPRATVDDPFCPQHLSPSFGAPFKAMSLSVFPAIFTACCRGTTSSPSVSWRCSVRSEKTMICGKSLGPWPIRSARPSLIKRDSVVLWRIRPAAVRRRKSAWQRAFPASSLVSLLAARLPRRTLSSPENLEPVPKTCPQRSPCSRAPMRIGERRLEAGSCVRRVLWLVPHQAARLSLRADGVGEAGGACGGERAQELGPLRPIQPEGPRGRGLID
jgi:hypothetical protein